MVAPVDRAGFDQVLAEAEARRHALAPRLDALAAARRVTVYSYGARGRDLAMQLRRRGVECLVSDNGEASRARAAAEGFEVARELRPDLPLIVAAGQNQLEIFATLDRDSYGLAEALWAFDLHNQYARARDFSTVVRDQADAFWAQHQRFDPAWRPAFLDVLAFRTSLDVRRVAATRRPMAQMWQAPAPPDGIGSFCDVGAYDGDSLIAMKAAFPALRRSFTVEPNPALAGTIQAAATAQGLSNRHFVGVAWDRRARVAAEPLFNDYFHICEAEGGDIQAETLDAMTAGEAYDYVKFDVEGAEAEAMRGGAGLLRGARCIAIAAYHLPTDLVDLPAVARDLLQGQDDWRWAFAHYSQSFDDSIVYLYR